MKNLSNKVNEMNKYMAILLLALLPALLAMSATANSSSLLDFENALKTSNPDTLPFLVDLDGNCPVEEKEVNDLVEGVIVKSRIKPDVDAMFHRETLFTHLTRVYLSVAMTCIETSTGQYSAAYTVFFGRAITNGRGTLFPFVFETHSVAVAIGEKEYLVTNLKGLIENRMTDYLEANFDL